MLLLLKIKQKINKQSSNKSSKSIKKTHWYYGSFVLVLDGYLQSMFFKINYYYLKLNRKSTNKVATKVENP